MGRIKPANVKKAAKQLVEENRELFSADFEKNKEILKDIVQHKKTRNMIAGYIARLIKKQK